MGMFGFTYADTGKSIIASKGYIYISKAMQKAIDYNKSALRFTYVNGYGDFDILRKNNKDTLTLDIYALKAMQLYLAGLLKGLTKTDIENLQDTIANFRLAMTQPDIEIKEYSDKIRHLGIKNSFNNEKPCDRKSYTLPHIGNQNAKMIYFDKISRTPVPIIITKKRLENMVVTKSRQITPDDDVCDIAYKWGMVSSDDPSQGFYESRDIWVKYEYPEK